MVDNLSAEAQIERLQEESRSCIYPTDAPDIKKRYKDTALLLFKEDLDDGTLRNYLTFGTRRSSSVSQYGNTPVVIRRSRSSNGELTTVIEQVSALHGRSTRSNYTLLEAGEKETDSDDENDFHESRFNSDESFGVKENNEKDSKHKADSTESVQKDQEVKTASNIDPQSTTCPQESISTISEQQNQDQDNKKSFSHYDATAQHSRESVEGDAVQLLQEVGSHDNRRMSKDSEKITSEVSEVSAFDESRQLTTDAHKDNISSLSSTHNFSHRVPEDICSQPISEEKDISQTECLQNTCEPTPITSSDTPITSSDTLIISSDTPITISDTPIISSDTPIISSDIPVTSSDTPITSNDIPIINSNTSITNSDKVQNTRSSPEVDHEAILRRYVQQPSCRSKSLLHGKDEANLCTPETSKKEEPNENFKLVELKIVEPTDSIFEEANSGTGAPDTQKTLTTSDIPHLSDESEVVFIDAGSPSLSRTNISCESSSGSSEDVLQCHGKGASSLDKATDTTDKPTITPQASEPDTVSKNSENKKEEISTRRRHDTHNSFRDLPIRSPTPPRRRPLRSPRIPKLREKTRHRHSSLALTSDEETQELLTNGTRSASPTSKIGDFRFFSFSLKKEKSKSATSLGSKRNREKVRLTSVKLSLEDPGAVNPKLVPTRIEDGHLDNSGKRVGVRSMIIDGTIKRNFIVIHPSDDSDTIGLAPVSPQAVEKKLTPASTPEALSTVKTRITASNTDKFEVMKRISCQGGLKEELSDIPENLRDESKKSFRGSRSVSQISNKSLKIKQNKKNSEHLPLKVSHSMSSEPVCPSPSSSQILYKSPPSLSRVDCDSLSNVSAQKVHHAGNSRTVSKMCVVM